MLPLFQFPATFVCSWPTWDTEQLNATTLSRVRSTTFSETPVGVSWLALGKILHSDPTTDPAPVPTGREQTNLIFGIQIRIYISCDSLETLLETIHEAADSRRNIEKTSNKSFSIR